MNVGSLIPVVVLVLPFVFVIFVLWIKSNEKHKRDQLWTDLYLKALEKGETIPKDLLEPPKKKNNSLRTAIILISIGIGISIFMYIVSDPQNQMKSVATGLIPLFLGIGFLVIHFIWKRQGIEDEE